MGCVGLVAGALYAYPRWSPPEQPGQISSGSQASPTAFDKAKAWEHLVKQCSFGPRDIGSKGYEDTKKYLVEEMSKHCDNVRLQQFSHVWSTTNKRVIMANVIGEQNWKDAKIRVLLLAHWDTRPTSDEDDPINFKKPIMGANDGASGVAVLLEMMRVMKGRLPKDVGVMYLMTDGEDLGPGLDEMFLGAKEFARKMPTPRPDYGILLDMIGDKNLRIPLEPNSMRYAGTLLREFYLNAGKQGLKDTFPMTQGPMIEDDHICLNEAGLPTIDLIDFDYSPWHTQRDTVDKCSPESLGKVGLALETWLLKDPPFKIK